LDGGEHVEFNDNTVFHFAETQTERVMLNAVKHPAGVNAKYTSAVHGLFASETLKGLAGLQEPITSEALQRLIITKPPPIVPLPAKGGTKRTAAADYSSRWCTGSRINGGTALSPVCFP